MKGKKNKVERVIAFEGEDDFILGCGDKMNHVKAGDELSVSADGATTQIRNVTSEQTAPQPVRCSIFSLRGGSMVKEGDGTVPTWSARDINNNPVSGVVGLNQIIQTPCIQDNTLVLNNVMVGNSSFCGTYTPPPVTDIQLIPDEPSPVFKDYKSMSCQEMDNYIAEIRDILSSGSTTSGALTISQRAAYDTHFAALMSYYDSTCKVVAPPPKPKPPTLPEWSSFNCEKLKEELKSFAEKITTGSFGDFTEMAQNHLVLGQEQEKKTCAVAKPSTNTITSTTTITPTFFGGGGFGGALGGGGGGESSDTPVQEKKKSNWLLWLVVAGLGLYYITKKKS